MLTDRDFAILCAVVRYYVLNRQQIQRICFPQDPNGRVTRRRLQALVSASLLNRQNTLFCHPLAGPAAPVYFPSRKGCELLAEMHDDERFLTTPTQAPIPHHTLHWLAVSDTHITLDDAIKAQTAVRLDGWLNEWDVCNKDESAPEKRFRLYSLIRESPRLVCAPDAGFLLTVNGHSKVFYLEQDRNTSGVRQIAASKTQGYAIMAQTQMHRRHYSTATVNSFSVLMVAPTERRRDALRKAIHSKPGSELWRFAAVPDLTSERFLHSPIFYPCIGDPVPLVKLQVDAPPEIPSISVGASP
jgi:Replication-relaxation